MHESLRGSRASGPPAEGRSRAAGDLRRRRAGRAALAFATASAVGIGALAVGAAPAVAAGEVGPNEWGYELITPADGRSDEIYGVGVSEDMSTVIATTFSLPLPGQPADGRVITYHTALPRGGTPWSLGDFDFRSGNQIHSKRVFIARDGSRATYNTKGSPWWFSGPGGISEPVFSLGSGPFAVTPYLDVVASRAGSGSLQPVSVERVGEPPIVASVDESGDPIHTYSLGAATSISGNTATGVYNALSEDGSSVIYATTYAFAGDNDGARRDVIRRIVTPGAEETFVVSDASEGATADGAADANYLWATADHSRIFFTTAEGLESGDTDGRWDIYMREGSAPPVRVSQGETVDRVPTGNEVIGSTPEATGNGNPEWASASADGNRVYFTTSERLTEEAPSEVLSSGAVLLYERDLAKGRTTFVAGPLKNGEPYRGGRSYPNMRGIRVFDGGVIFHSASALAGAPNDGLTKVFRWTHEDGLTHVSKPAAGAPPSPPAKAEFTADTLRIVTSNDDLQPFTGGRGVSDDGSTVFFTTAESLVAEDTDGGYKDVYRWKKGEGLSLVSLPGRAPYSSGYLESSPDGREVYFTTDESIVSEDIDPNAKDVYLAILGGGSKPAAPPPDADPVICTGDACQGSSAPSGGPLDVGSVGFVGAGNLLEPADAAKGAAKASVSVSKPKAVRGTRTTLRVRVSERGRVRVSGSGLARTSKSVSKAGTHRVSVRLSQRAQRTLRRNGRVKVRASVRLTPQKGRSVVKRVSVTFRSAKATSKKGGR